MTSRERMLAAMRHESVDHVPLYAWVFGFQPMEQSKNNIDNSSNVHYNEHINEKTKRSAINNEEAV